jgi:hypothetical protein
MPAIQPHLKESALKIPNEIKHDARTPELNTPQWHKSAPWLISAATILGLIVILQK